MCLICDESISHPNKQNHLRNRHVTKLIEDVRRDYVQQVVESVCRCIFCDSDYLPCKDTEKHIKERTSEGLYKNVSRIVFRPTKLECHPGKV